MAQIDYKKYTVIGIDQVSQPTPAWVKKSVAIFMVISGAVSNWAYMTTIIPESAKPEVLLLTGTLTAAVAAIAPFFGIKTKAVRQ